MDNMKFKKYSSIENGYREKFIDFVKDHPNFPTAKWQITEKIHGSNYSFVVDVTEGSEYVRVAKRSGLTDGTFYASQSVYDKYYNNALKLAKFLRKNDECQCGYGEKLMTVQIYGELYGEGVQKGVYYSAEKQFAAFDIRVTYSVDGEEKSEYLWTDVVEKLCEKFGIPHVPIIEREISFANAMNYQHQFQSLIAKDREGENFAEGVVIKPIVPFFLGNGERVIIKRKNDKFKEVQKSKKVRKQESWTDTMNHVYAVMATYNTEERIRSAVSKIGTITQRDFGKLLGTVSKDLLDDWRKDHDWGSLEKSEQKVITGKLNKDVGALIRENFLNIMDGKF